MKYLVLLTPAKGHPFSEFEPFLIEEEKAVWSAYRDGRLREWYIQPEPLTVTFVFEADTVEAVRAELALFPLIKAGLLDDQIIALGPWVQIEMLFDKRYMQTDSSLPD